MKKQLLLLVMIFLPIVISSADTVEINGIFYNLTTKGNVAEVTSNPNLYKGNIDIPEAVTFEDSNFNVTSIGERAFANCVDLSSISIPNTIESIGVYAFYECGLSSISIPESVNRVYSGAFANCSNLKAVHVKNIESWCKIIFEDIHANPLLNAKHLFINNEEIKNIVIPNSITKIEDFTFTNCYEITNVSIPNSVITIGQQSFGDCTGIKALTIPNSVNSIGYNAFSGCSSMSSVILPTNLSIISRGMFAGCSSLNSIEIPDNVTSINNGAFMYCSGLTSITLPSKVTQIGTYAFSGCSELLTVSLGKSLQHINDYAFENCKKMKDVYCYAEKVPNTGSKAFNDSGIEFTTLHVPYNDILVYQSTEPWKNFKEIVAIENSPESPKCEIPTITYENGTLKLKCSTEGVDFITDITSSDIQKYYSNEIILTATYNINFYATKIGYEKSDVATATLCWIKSDPVIEGFTNGIVKVPAHMVLIQNHGGILTIQGIDEGTFVAVYDINGIRTGSATSQDGHVSLATNLKKGDIAIIKIGEKSVKVVIQ